MQKGSLLLAVIQRIILGVAHSASPKQHTSLMSLPSHDIIPQTTSVNRLQDPRMWLTDNVNLKPNPA